MTGTTHQGTLPGSACSCGGGKGGGKGGSGTAGGAGLGTSTVTTNDSLTSSSAHGTTTVVSRIQPSSALMYGVRSSPDCGYSCTPTLKLDVSVQTSSSAVASCSSA